MFECGFPMELRTDVFVVEQHMPRKTYHNIKSQTENCSSYTLQDGQTILFPDRMYYVEESREAPGVLTQTQKTIYHAIYTRSYDGFVREKHVRALLENELPEWISPYILKLSDEYVKEIVECLYVELRSRDTDWLKTFCVLNLQQFLKGHARMVSYWNAYYRCYSYQDYVGRKLYEECFGYSTSLEKMRTKRV